MVVAAEIRREGQCDPDFPVAERSGRLRACCYTSMGSIIVMSTPNREKLMGEAGKHPTRQEALAMLRAAAGHPEKIKEWNECRAQHPDWKPDLSDNEDRADLQGLELNGADLSEAKLMYADLSGAALLRTRLSRATLMGANVSGANLGYVNLNDADVTEVQYDRAGMDGCYRGVRVATCFGDAVFKRDAQDQDFVDTLHARLEGGVEHFRSNRPGPHDNPSFARWRRHASAEIKWRLFRAWRWIDYGRSLTRTAGIAFLIAMLFGAVFLGADLLGYRMLSYQSGTPDWWYTPFFYSIVTYTTLGFGDVTAMTKVAQLLVTVEVILGYLTLGLLISILANKVARRS